MNQHLIENRQIRIFISSTFQDMKAERDYLMNKTFPLLRKKASERDVTLIELDLRWGITEAEAQNGKVVEVCLNEIENSHPFFIGLLGERYGWCPSVKELMKNENLRDRYGWLEKDLKEGLSVTEIEMQYGVLRSKEPIYAYFYIKRGDVGLSNIEQTEREKLARLKETVRNSKRYPVADYSDAEDLGDQISTAFVELLDKLFPKKEITFLEKERIAQKAFLNSRCNVYIPDENNFLVLDQFLENKEEQHYVVTGGSGMGKSALIANWLKRHESDEEQNIIYHFVGNSSSENDYQRILKRLIDEIRDIYQLPKKEDDQQWEKKKDLKDELQDLLVQISVKKSLLIVLDGINQLEEKKNIKRLNWLPALPKNVKMLFSTLELDQTMDTFREFYYPLLVLQPLDNAKQRTLIVDYLYRYGKKLTEVQINRILENDLIKNTLVLRTLLDELVCFGIYERLNEHIDYYLAASDISDFFQRILRRCENDYGQDLVSCALSYITVSRSGLREDELLALTGLSPLYWSQFYCALSAHFTVKSGLITFSHQYVREAVEKVYLIEEATVDSLRKTVVHYFEQEHGYRAYDELSYQYDLLDDDDSLYRLLLDFKVFDYFRDKSIYELGSYWRKLLKSEKGTYSLEEYLNLPMEEVERKILGRLYDDIGYCIGEVIANNSLSLKFHQEALKIHRQEFGENHSNIANSYNNIGWVYCTQGDYSTALEYNEKVLDIYIQIFGADHINTALSYNNIASVYSEQGDYPAALKYFEKASDIYVRVLGTNHPNTATSYNNMGWVYCTQGDYPTAFNYFEKALKVCLQVLGVEHPNTALSYDNIGSVYRDQGDYSTALNYYEKALSIYIQILGTDHPNIATSYNNIGSIYSTQGDCSTALNYYEKALSIYIQFLGADHVDVATSYNNIGLQYDNQGDYSTALNYYEKALNIYIQALGANHPSIAFVYNNIGWAYNAQGDYSTALGYYEKALNIYIQVLGMAHPNTALVYNNIGSVYRNQGDYLAALSCYEKALNIYQQIFGMEHSKTLNIYHYMADTYLKLQQYQEALPYFIKEMEYNIKLKGESDTCIYYSYSRIGTCYFGMSEYKSAVFYLLKACDYEEKNSVDVYYLASSLCQLGKCNDALPLFESIVDQFSGEDKTHVDILCANSIFLMGNYSIALSKHIEVLDARKELYKPDSDEIATSYSWVGRCYIMLGDAEKGISYLEENIRIASEDIWTSISWQYMGIAYQKLQNIEKASECFQKAFTLLEDCSSSLYLQKARVFNSHAVFLLAQKDTRNANLQIQKALKFAHLYLDYLKCDEHPVLGHILMLQSDIIEAEQGTNEQVGQLRTQANEIFKEYLGVDCPFIRNPLQT